MKKQDPRVVRTQRLLKNAIIELMEEKEFDQITIQDISDRATIKRVTFYLHYNDKHDLMMQCAHEILEGTREKVMATVSFTEHFDYLKNEPHPSFVELFHQIAKHFFFYRAVLVTNRIPQVTEGLLDIIHEFISDGIHQVEPDDENLVASRDLVIKYVESAFLEVIIWWIENNMHYSEYDIALQLMNISIQGPYKKPPLQKKNH